MRVSDYLSSFSIDDLRVLAVRRGAGGAIRREVSRQELVAILSQVLSRIDATFDAVAMLNRGSLAVLQSARKLGKQAGLSRIAESLGAPREVIQAHLNELRLWGLLFPEGDWEHIVGINNLHHALMYVGESGDSRVVQLTPPVYPLVGNEGLRVREGSLALDLAEFLARVARSRLRLTQHRDFNRRDLKQIAGGLAVKDPSYSLFMEQFTLKQGMFATHLVDRYEVLSVAQDIDELLGRDRETLETYLLNAWLDLGSFPETTLAGPIGPAHVPSYTSLARRQTVMMLLELPPDGALEVAGAVEWLRWTLPMAVRHATPDHERNVVSNLIRSAYWLGLCAVDAGETPTRFGPSEYLRQIYSYTMQPESQRVGAPYDPQIVVQPNADVFTPPNASPRTYFHVRRLTGEKKGSVAGMHPLSQESLRRAYDNGATPKGVLAFLEAFSRTPLPGSVRALVESTGRQHGRIRVVPADYVLLTDDAALMNELRALKSVGGQMGAELTERCCVVSGEKLNELMRNLRARGYAPRNDAEIVKGPELPQRVEHPAMTPERQLDDGISPEEEAAEGVTRYTTGEEIRKLLRRGVDAGMELRVSYLSPVGEIEVLLWPFYLDESHVEGFCPSVDEDRRLEIRRIEWAEIVGLARWAN